MEISQTAITFRRIYRGFVLHYQRAINGLKGWIECFPKAQLAGSVFAGGVTDMGEINGHKSLTQAYEMGSNV